jgi:hypothetical protein
MIETKEEDEPTPSKTLAETVFGGGRDTTIIGDILRKGTALK